MAGVTAIRLIRQRRPIRRKHPAERPPVYQGDCLLSPKNRNTAPQILEKIGDFLNGKSPKAKRKKKQRIKMELKLLNSRT